MFEVFSSLLKYIFITIIYLFIFSIIKLIYLDINSINARGKRGKTDSPYLKLINRREDLDFKVEETYMLDSGGLEVGRSVKEGIVINDPYISGRHAKFSCRDGEYFVEDLGSKNGIFVNNEKIEGSSATLKNGDRIHIGQLDFLFVVNKA